MCFGAQFLLLPLFKEGGEIHPWIKHRREFRAHADKSHFRGVFWLLLMHNWLFCGVFCVGFFFCVRFFLTLNTKPLSRKCSNFLPCYHALESTLWGHGQGLLIFYFSGSVPWLNKLTQVRHCECCLANIPLLTNSLWKETAVLLSAKLRLHCGSEQMCEVSCIFYAA